MCRHGFISSTICERRFICMYKPSLASSPNLTLLLPHGLLASSGDGRLEYMVCGSSLKVCAACLIAWGPGCTWPMAQQISERWHRLACASCLATLCWRTHR